MQFHKSRQYKVVELSHALVIIDPDDSVKDVNQQPLMQGTYEQVLLYLDRYLFERNHGTEMRTAHERALNSAGITVAVKGARG